jgi:hypothetical protein
MGKSLKTAAAIMAVLFIAAGTVSAQQKKQVEKKVTIVTVDANGVEKDTTITSHDTMDFKGDRIIIETKDGKEWSGKEKGDKMIFVEKEMGGPGMSSGREMRQICCNPEAKEGVNYNLSIELL